MLHSIIYCPKIIYPTYRQNQSVLHLNPLHLNNKHNQYHNRLDQQTNYNSIINNNNNNRNLNNNNNNNNNNSNNYY